MGCFPNIRREVENMQKMLKGRPDDKLIAGYKKAMEAYEKTKEMNHKNAADLIKKEIDIRGLKVDEGF